eukprot:Rhum_TRINITY_DN26147_c0_g1::Rhum_TRINITY_DN26147_c0_g1_i1::g.183371::m.183371
MKVLHPVSNFQDCNLAPQYMQYVFAVPGSGTIAVSHWLHHKWPGSPTGTTVGSGSGGGSGSGSACEGLAAFPKLLPPTLAAAMLYSASSSNSRTLPLLPQPPPPAPAAAFC